MRVSVYYYVNVCGSEYVRVRPVRACSCAFVRASVRACGRIRDSVA